MTARRVRVTVEGTAEQASHMPSVLRIQLGSGHLYVDTAAPGVTLEELAPPRTWTDGDVVQGAGAAWSRVDGQWLCPSAFGFSSTAQDGDVNDLLASGKWQVLRYQHDALAGA